MLAVSSYLGYAAAVTQFVVEKCLESHFGIQESNSLCYYSNLVFSADDRSALGTVENRSIIIALVTSPITKSANFYPWLSYCSAIGFFSLLSFSVVGYPVLFFSGIF